MRLSRRWLWLLALVPIAFGLLRLRFDVEVLDLLPTDAPAVQGLKIYQQHFANARELIITVRGTNAVTAEGAARSVAEALRRETNLISEVVWQPPWLEHPEQTAEFIGFLWFNQPPEIFSRLTNRLASENLSRRLESAREQLATSMSPGEIGQLSYDPLGLTRLPEDATVGAPLFGGGQEMFVSPDGTFRILFVQARPDVSGYRDCARWFDNLKQIVNRTVTPAERRAGGISIGYTGRPAFVAEIAGGMERDITRSVGTTIVIIALLFWWAHRRWQPLLWLLALLALILCATLGLGGLLLGTLNVVSVGFAAILLGLSVDYGMVLYQESLRAPGLSVAALRRVLAPGIGWSAVTTAGAFFVLQWGGLPGLAQLGLLVAVGVTLAAIAMLNFFLPPLRRAGISPDRRPDALTPRRMQSGLLCWIGTVLALLGMVAVLSSGLPALDHTANSLRPRHSAAYAALDEIKARMGRSQEPWWLLVAGRQESEVARRLDQSLPILRRAVSNQQLTGFTLPSALWPRPEFQSANRATARRLTAQRESLRSAVQSAGFTDNATTFAENVLDVWRRCAASPQAFWPTNELSRWIMEKFAARTPTNLFALGLLYPDARTAPANPPSNPIADLSSQLPRDGVWIAGWEMLGAALLEIVEKDFWHVMLPMLVLLIGSLWLAFKRFTEVFLSLASLAFSLLCLLGTMKLAGWSWNLLNLMALPLLLGAGVDYSIHMQLALRRHGGDIAETRRGVGRALFLCAGTTVTGFGSNVFSSNGGLVSLGQVCASGVAFAYLSSAWLLPVWWRTFAAKTANIAHATPESTAAISSTLRPHLSSPSSLYRAEFWRLGVLAGRRLSSQTCTRLSRSLAGVYWALAVRRREIVIQNLLPPLRGDRQAAEEASRELFHNFAIKLADLFRYESGQSISDMFGELTGWEYFTSAQATGRGVLLVTPHLGNWEFGAPLLAQRGVKLLVITLDEPERRLTQLRQASRARWGIETLVVGRDPFAFVEMVRHLEAGAAVALLMDRPPETSAVTVELFGGKFAASVAAAELARASGCALLPVHLPRTDGRYAAHILPQIPYDRAALRSREARQKLTQEIMRAFEPAIRQHPDQWYHFVPIWPV